MAQEIAGVKFYLASGEDGPFKPICVPPGPNEYGLSLSLWHVDGVVVGVSAYIFDEDEDDYVSAGSLGLIPAELT